MYTWGNVMKPILYTGAMDAETLYLMQELKQPERVTLGCWKCMRGTLDDIPVVIVRTNQGMANAAAATALAIEYFEPQAILNQGTSGGHAPDLHRGDIVLGARVINMTAVRTPDRARGAGMDLEHAEPLGLEIANINPGDGKKMTVFPADAALLSAAEQTKYAEGRVVTGTIGSGDIWNNELDRIHWLHTNWGTLTEEMETAACAQICMAYGIPFLGIRILSNTAVHGETFDETTGTRCQKFARAVIMEYCKRLNIK
ncbi:MAG: 5'-methylthioadenosine/S-adenosylhomocysteine nucleosidase [Butyricicoccus pullicaecorum]|nr:5'-methylthioadenosine/S-adenosylhomocysteine nucleosidase [Butyricicoccus pullicaecorum]